jgi:hypothetical protein
MTKRWYFKAFAALAVFAALVLTFTAVLKPWYTDWGATPEEIARAMPGDDLVPQPARSYTRAITIRAAPEAIWPWLAQFGQAEGGMYSYTGIEQAIGCDMKNTDRIVPEWQTISPGDDVRMCQEGYGPAPYEVAAVEPGSALIMGHRAEAGKAWADSWTFVLSPIDARSTRLYIRTRTTLTGLMWDVIDPGVFLMEYGMLNGIKTRAEGGLGG